MTHSTDDIGPQDLAHGQQLADEAVTAAKVATGVDLGRLLDDTERLIRRFVMLSDDQAVGVTLHVGGTQSELAKMFNVSETTIEAWSISGRIPSLRPTKRTIRYDPDEVLRFLQEKGEK